MLNVLPRFAAWQKGTMTSKNSATLPHIRGNCHLFKNRPELLFNGLFED